MRKFYCILIVGVMLAACNTTTPQAAVISSIVPSTPTSDVQAYPPPLITPTALFTPTNRPTRTLTPFPSPVVAKVITATTELDTLNVEVVGYAHTIRADSIDVEGNWAYVTNFVDGIRVVDISKVVLVKTASKGFGRLARLAFGGYANGQLAVAGNYAYWIGEGAAWHSQIIDITNPAHLEKVSDLPISGNQIKIVGDLAYVSSQAEMHILDISNLQNVIELGYYQKNWEPGEVINGSCLEKEQLAVYGHYAYMTMCVGLQVVNVETPSNPIKVKFYPMEGAGAVVVRDNYIYVGWRKNPYGHIPCHRSDCDERGMTILKITPSGELVETGIYRIDDGRIHIANMAVDSHYAYLAMYEYGVRVIDISNPSQPIEVGYFDTPGSALDVTVADGLVYVADGSEGVWILKRSP